MIDGRNFYNPDRLVEAGFIYEGIGRSRAGVQKTAVKAVEPVPELQSVLGGLSSPSPVL
jgi:hypothetical protein